MSAPAFGDAPLWYLARSTGITAFVLATVALGLGIASTQRALASPHWPRLATQRLHRNLSLLALAFVVLHVTTTVVDSYVDLSAWAAVVPGASHYHRLSVALGTLACDLLLLVVATSLQRHRLPARLWKTVHLSAYALWPLMWLHFLTVGTDAAHGRFGVWVALAGAAVVGAAVSVRLRTAVPTTAVGAP